MPRTLNRRTIFNAAFLAVYGAYGMSKVLVECCNKKLKPEHEYRILDYPVIGDMTDLYPATCHKCGCIRYAYASFNFHGWATGLLQADKHRRLKFDTLLKTGDYQIIQKPDPDKKSTKGAQFASEYTMKISHLSIEGLGQYLKTIDRATTICAV